MMTMMPIEISACCLLARPSLEVSQWQTRFQQLEVVEPDASVAKEFIERAIDLEGLEHGVTDADVLVSTIHPEHVDHSALITHADLEVPDGQERYWDLEIWTVCGVFDDNGQCYSDVWTAYGPLAAYGTAWNHWRKNGRNLLVAGVHQGDVARVSWSPTFADPTCTTEDAMLSRLAELVPERA